MGCFQLEIKNFPGKKFFILGQKGNDFLGKKKIIFRGILRKGITSLIIKLQTIYSASPSG